MAGRRYPWLSLAAYAAITWLRGLLDALNVLSWLEYSVLDRKIGRLLIRSAVLNGLAVGAAAWASASTLGPGVARALAPRLGAAHAARAERLATLLFGAAWLWPAYAISLAANAIWCGELASRAAIVAQLKAQARRGGGHAGAAMLAGEGHWRPISFASFFGGPSRGEPVTSPGEGGEPASGPVPSHHLPPPRSQSSTLALVAAEAAHRALVLGTALMLPSLVPPIPLVGTPLRLLASSWMYALCCFDARWGSHQIPLRARALFFDRHAFYMLGFGSPATALESAFPGLLGQSLAAALFPLLAVAACDAAPRRAAEQTRLLFPARARPALAAASVPAYASAATVADAAVRAVGWLLWAVRGRRRRARARAAAPGLNAPAPREVPRG